jgi:hypothetical protein
MKKHLLAVSLLISIQMSYPLNVFADTAIKNPDFGSFRLGDSMKAGQDLAAGEYRLREMQRNQDNHQATDAPTPGSGFDECFSQCKQHTKRTDEQCFDSCKR